MLKFFALAKEEVSILEHAVYFNVSVFPTR